MIQVSVKLKKMFWLGSLLIMFAWGIVSYGERLAEEKDRTELLSKKELLTKELRLLQQSLQLLPREKHFETISCYQQLLEQINTAHLELLQITLENEIETEQMPSFSLKLRGDFAKLQQLLRLIEARPSMEIWQLSLEANPDPERTETLIVQLEIAFPK